MSWRDRLPRVLRRRPPDPPRSRLIHDFLELVIEDLAEDEWEVLVAEAEKQKQAGTINFPFPQLFYFPGENRTLIATVPEENREREDALFERAGRFQGWIRRALFEDCDLVVFRGTVESEEEPEVKEEEALAPAAA